MTISGPAVGTLKAYPLRKPIRSLVVETSPSVGIFLGVERFLA
jgi:hypothetical protein